ncbi:MAG: DUF4430 domain-containing protein [Clostridiales Family XIII bacterium]|nr:DUF4430 domain-containing protein [Clostridiales Family XIII bacterium]
MRNGDGGAVWELTAVPAIDYALDYFEYSTDAGLSWHIDGASRGIAPSYTKLDVPVSGGGVEARYAHTVSIGQDTLYRAAFVPAVLKLTGDARLVRYAAVPGEDIEPDRSSNDLTWYGGQATRWSGGTFRSMSPVTGSEGGHAAVAGEPALLMVDWAPTGPIKVDRYEGRDAPLPNAALGKYVSLALYADGENEPFLECEDIVLFSPGVSYTDGIEYQTLRGINSPYAFHLFFIMPETPELSFKLTFKDYDGRVISEDETSLRTPMSAGISALKRDYDTLENLKWRYLINHTLSAAGDAIAKTEDEGAIAAILAGAEARIKGYIEGTLEDYIVASFNGQTVRVPDKISQAEAMQASLEQSYPREKGYWYLDVAPGAFGFWVNGLGGRLYTEGELHSGLLETAIETPTKTWAAGEPLPRSGLIYGPQSGGLTYGVNGFFANFGISGWLCSYGDRFSWGPYGDDGIADWGEGGCEPWSLPPDFIGDATVQAALAACEALDALSPEGEILAARAAFEKFSKTDMSFWNPSYARYLFMNYEPYKGAYEKLLAAEGEAGISDPMPTVTAEEALAGVLDYLQDAVAEPGFGDEWAVLALARGGIEPAPDYYDGYYNEAVEYIKGKDTGKLDANKSTENSRLILALSSIGRDARAAGEIDLIAPFADQGWVVNQGLNGAIYALLALDTNDYEIPTDGEVSQQATRESLIGHILDAAIEGGGWSLYRDDAAADVDITAMALQALAPYYRDAVAESAGPGPEDADPIIAKADAALEWLKAQQKDDGGFAANLAYAPSGDTSASSTAQVVTALAALGIRPDYEEYGWTKPGGWNPVVALLASYNEEGGWFGENGPAERNGFATEQAAYALVAYSRLISGQPRLYDMADAFPDPERDSAAILAAKALVEAAEYRAAQAEAGSAEAALAKAKQIVAGLALKGVRAEVTGGAFVAPLAGTEESPAGTDGSYAFAVALSKNAGAPQVAEGLILTIAATPYEAPPESMTVSFRLIGDSLHGLADAPQYADWIAEGPVTLTGAGPFTVLDALAEAAGKAGMAYAAEGGHVASVTDGEGATLVRYGNGSPGSAWGYFLNGEIGGTPPGGQAIAGGDAITLFYANDSAAESAAWAAAYPNMPALVGIEVTSQPDKTSYALGDRLKLAGLAITADYGDGLTAVIAYGAPLRFALSHANNAELGTAGTVTVTVTYQGWTASFDVAVSDGQAELAAAKAARIALIGAVGDSLAESDYTQDSWAALQTAIAEAIQAVSDAASVAEANAVPLPSAAGLVAASGDAEAALLAAKAAKAAAVSAAAAGLAEGDYTQDSWAALQSAIAEALGAVEAAASLEAVAAVEVPSAAGLVTLASQLAEARAAKIGLIEAADDSLAEADYTYESWLAFQSAVAYALQAAGDAETLAELDAVELPSEALLVARPADPGADKAALDAEIERAGGIAQGSYTDSSYSRMQTVLAAARAVAANAEATQEAVDDARNALAAAISGLKAASSGGPSEPARRYATIGVADPGAHDGQTATYYGSRRLEISGSETAFTLLQRTGLSLDYSGHAEYAGYYVKSINGFGEFSDGSRSGWMYSVNGVFPGYSSSLYYLNDGDTVRWLYTRDLGNDIDAAYAIGAATSPSGSGTTAAPAAPAVDEAAQEAAGGGGGENPPVATVTVDAAPVPVAPDGKATAAVETEAVAKAVEEAAKAVEEARAGGNADAVAEIRIVVRTETAAEAGASETAPAVRIAEAAIPAEAIKAVADAKDLVLTVESDVSTITLDAGALASVAAEARAGETVSIAASVVDRAEALNARQREMAGDSPVIEISVSVGGRAVTGFGGSVTVSVPYAPPEGLDAGDYDLLTVYYLDGDGSVQEMAGAGYDAKTGLITFATAHLSKFFIGEWISPFADIAKGDWFYRAARHAYSGGLINGVADGSFAPQAKLSRAMLVTMLARDAGVDTGGGATWYGKAAEWGVANGITDGTDMAGDLTREQFAAILYRYARLNGADVGGAADLAAYGDAGAVSGWAKDAVSWAVAAGLIEGRTETELAPGGTATRAEAAALLMRYAALAE